MRCVGFGGRAASPGRALRAQPCSRGRGGLAREPEEDTGGAWGWLVPDGDGGACGQLPPPGLGRCSGSEDSWEGREVRGLRELLFPIQWPPCQSG